MPIGNEGQQSDVDDLDQKIADRSRAIALDPNNAKAYRDRGLLHARKREYDLSMSDLSRALLLNPSDAHSFGLRGLVWEKKNDTKRALADLEKAIQLDPINAAVYRTHRENILRNDAHVVNDRNDSAATPHGLGGFFKRLAQYYAEFLSTDFKKQRLPRRRLQTSDAQGRLVGIPLRKYPGFQQKIWEELAEPIGTGLSIKIARGSWRSSLPKAVVEATTTHIGYVTQEDLNEVVNTVLGRVAGIAKTKGSDPVVALIRLNRFNLGRDPVATIDGLLRERLDGLINGEGPHALVAKMAEKAGEIEQGLKSGEYKRCKKCDRDLPVNMFRDDSAKSGQGRHCRECKSTAPKSHKARFRRSYRR